MACSGVPGGLAFAAIRDHTGGSSHPDVRVVLNPRQATFAVLAGISEFSVG